MDTDAPYNFGPESPSTSRWTGRGGRWCWILTLFLFAVVGIRSTHAQTATTVNKRISAGRLHTVVVRDDGTVWQWGYHNAEPKQVVSFSNVVSVAAAYYAEHSYGLKADGTVWTWGAPFYAPVQVSGISNVKAIAAGTDHVVAVKNDGTVWTWGGNGYGQLGNGTTTANSTPTQVSGLSDIVQVASGLMHVLALKDDGTVYAWGSNVTGALGDGTTTQRLGRPPVIGQG